MQNLFLAPEKMSNGPKLSEDIIEDILSRLPVKSVCRFRCVSKLWLHLTTQPRFIQAHLKRSQCKILLSSKDSLSSLDHLAPIDDDLLPLELDFPLKNNSWKRVQDFPYKHLLDDSTTFLNGAVHWLCGPVHWLCGPVGVGDTCVIAAFDLAEEKFLDLAPPDSVTNHTRFTIGVLGGCLCLLHQNSIKQHSFWVMKEYNVKESWTRILITDSYFSLQPLCYWKDGKILLVRNRKKLLLCNTKNGTCKKFLVNGLPSRIFAAVYVESLVSPNFQQN